MFTMPKISFTDIHTFLLWHSPDRESHITKNRTCTGVKQQSMITMFGLGKPQINPTWISSYILIMSRLWGTAYTRLFETPIEIARVLNIFYGFYNHYDSSEKTRRRRLDDKVVSPLKTLYEAHQDDSKFNWSVRSFLQPTLSHRP